MMQYQSMTSSSSTLNGWKNTSERQGSDLGESTVMPRVVHVLRGDIAASDSRSIFSPDHDASATASMVPNDVTE